MTPVFPAKDSPSRSDSFGPLILITGEEPYLITEWIQRIRKALIPPDAVDFNISVFSGSEIDMKALVGLAETFPLFSEKRLIIVKDGEQIPARELEKLLPYLESPLTSTCLVLVASKVDMRKGFFTRFKELGQVIACQKLYDNQVAPWIRGRFKDLQIDIDENAVHFLKTEIGPDLMKLSSEIEKLAAFAGKAGRVRHDDCVALVRGQRKYSLFDLVNAVGNKNEPEAMRLLRSILDEGEQPLVVLALLIRNFRNLLKVTEYRNRGLSKGEISKKLGVPEFYLNETFRHHGRYARRELVAAFVLLSEADFQLKNNLRGPERVLEGLLHDLITGKPVFTNQAVSN